MSEPDLAGPPRAPVALPEVVRRLAGDRPIAAVWVNQLGGITFRVDDALQPRFIKWSPPGGPDLSSEATRLRWAGQYVIVPEVLDQGADHAGHWLVTAALPGASAVSEVWRADPRPAARAIGVGLRRLHERLPVNGCPFIHWAAPERLTDLPGELSARPDVDRLVVCHGDPCAPNTLLAPDGRPAGHVDLGSLGPADRWADLAVATWSLAWNYGSGYESELLDAYGVRPDPERTSYYRRLWEISS